MIEEEEDDEETFDGDDGVGIVTPPASTAACAIACSSRMHLEVFRAPVACAPHSKPCLQDGDTRFLRCSRTHRRLLHA